MVRKYCIKTESIERLLLDLGYKERKRLFFNLSDLYKSTNSNNLFKRKVFRGDDKLILSYQSYLENITQTVEYKINNNLQFDCIDIDLFDCLTNLYKLVLHNYKDSFKEQLINYIEDNKLTFTNYLCESDLIKFERNNIRYFILEYYLKDKVKITFNNKDITHYLFMLK